MLWLSQEHRFTNSDNNKLPSEIVDAYSWCFTACYQKWGKNRNTKNIWFEFFLDKNYLGDDGFKNMFVYQPTINLLV